MSLRLKQSKTALPTRMAGELTQLVVSPGDPLLSIGREGLRPDAAPELRTRVVLLTTWRSPNDPQGFHDPLLGSLAEHERSTYAVVTNGLRLKQSRTGQGRTRHTETSPGRATDGYLEQGR